MLSKLLSSAGLVLWGFKSFRCDLSLDLCIFTPLPPESCTLLGAVTVCDDFLLQTFICCKISTFNFICMGFLTLSWSCFSTFSCRCLLHWCITSNTQHSGGSSSGTSISRPSSFFCPAYTLEFYVWRQLQALLLLWLTTKQQIHLVFYVKLNGLTFSVPLMKWVDSWGFFFFFVIAFSFFCHLKNLKIMYVQYC